MSNNEIKIKITEEFEDNRKKARNLATEVGNAGGFSGQHGKIRKSNVEASLAGIDAIFEKGNLSLTDLKELDKFFKSLYENLGKAAANTSQMSKELKELIDSQVKTLDKLNEKRKQQLDLLSEGKFDKESKKFTSTKDSAEILRSIGAFKVTKSGEASKRGEVNLANIMKNMEAGVQYVDKSGKNLADNPEFKEQVQKIQDLNKDYTNLSKAIDRYEKALNEAAEKIEKQTASDSKTPGVNSLSGKVVKTQVETSRLLGDAETSVAQSENAEKFKTSSLTSLPQLKEQSSALKKAFKQFSIYTLVINNARKALSSAVSTIRDLDRYLTEQAMVTGKTRKEVFGLVKTYQSLATQYNATTKEVAEVNTEFMRQGKSMKESTQLTEAALASARVAGISGAESVNYLTTALNGFQLAAKDAMKVSDKFAAVAAASATSYEEIAVALSKVASQANTAGMSIDYTTALLSKGIETTKEAPETIGTALKTVIARMRELGDYGETLSGDTDINNVETQLAYVGIELKNTNGELRSTEDVLDELGRKWDTLSSNQQAAVAKALAGTRQQSRLIAMMSDYERVIELQTIAQRSQGSTLAQMSALMTGLDASLNEIAIAWESIISSLVNNDFIVEIVDTFSDIMNFVKNIASSMGGQLAIYGALGGLALSLLNKAQERHKVNELERQQQRLFLAEEAEQAALRKEQEIAELEEEQENLFLSGQKLIQDKESLATQIEKTNNVLQEKIINQENLAIQYERAKLEGMLGGAGKKKLRELEFELAANKKSLEDGKEKLDQTKQQIAQEKKLLSEKSSKNKNKIDLKKQQKNQFEKVAKDSWDQFNAQAKINETLAARIPLLGGIMGTFSKMKSAVTYLGSEEFKQYALKVRQEAIEKRSLKTKSLETAQETAQTVQETAQTAQKVAQNALSIKDLAIAVAKKALESLSNPMAWIPIAVAGLGLLLKGLKKVFKSTKDRIKEINELSAANYKLNEQSAAIKNITSQYEKLDRQIIKTSESQEEMNKLLEEAGEKLDEEQKEYYETLGTEGKIKYLKGIEEQNRKEMEKNYKKQLKNMIKDRETLKNANVQATLQSMNNYYAGNFIDSFTDISDEDKLALEKFTQDMVAHMDNDTLIAWASDKGHFAIQSFVKQFKDVRLATSEGKDSIFNIFNSEDYGWADRVKAYKQALNELTGDAKDAFEQIYKPQYGFLETLGEETLEYFDKLGLSGEKISDLYDSFRTIQSADATKNLNLSEEQYKGKITEVFKQMSKEGRNLGDAIKDVFKDQLDQFEKGSEEYSEAVNTFVKTIGKAMEIGVLNMGQNIEKFENRIASVYEKAAQWNSLSETEKTNFINQEQELFKGPQGANVLKAFKDGNYKMIQEALESSDYLIREYEDRIAEIDSELDLETSRGDSEKNYAYIEHLENLKKLYSEKSNLFKISLEEEKKQQEAQLDAYRDYLQKQQDALTESLEKQKDAYEKYFDQINQAAEDEDYEEKADLLVSNISKLSGSNAATEAKRADLEKELEKMEKERLQDLRERAQEQIISNIEDEIEAISDKFDKLLDSNQALLLAMTGDVQNAEEFAAKMISTEIMSGNNTAVDIQSFLNDLQSNFGMLTSDYDFSKLDIKEDENKNLILNVNGTTYNLTQTENDNLFDVIMRALTQIGKF